MSKAISLPFVRSAFNYDRDVASDESGLKCEDPSKTQQSAAEECDINTIVRRFGLTGLLPQNVRVPTYGDFSGIFDYQSAMNVIRDADVAFKSMPADVRARFHNSADEFVDFVADEGNREEAIKLGLVVPPVLSLEDAPEAPAASQDVPTGVANP